MTLLSAFNAAAELEAVGPYMATFGAALTVVGGISWMSVVARHAARPLSSRSQR